MNRFHNLKTGLDYSDYNIDNKEYIIGNYIITNKRLGRGSSATVYLGKHKNTNIQVAIKKFELSDKFVS